MTISDGPARAALLRVLRSRYLDQLSAPQDFHSEFLNRTAERRILWRGAEAIGYFFASPAGTLLEFYVDDARLAERALEHVVSTHSPRRAYCKTSDPAALAAYAGRAARMTPIALLFTDMDDEGFTPDETIEVMTAERSDLTGIMAIGASVFDDENGARAHVERRRLFVYRSGETLIGCGLVQPVIAGAVAQDIGMVVEPGLRGRGYGEYIVRHLKAYCLSRGKRPVCCCGVDNAASRACLEAAGFRSRHRKVEFAWP